MKFKTAWGAALLLTAMTINTAWAKEGTSGAQAQTESVFAVEYGETLPPVGYVKFCASAPSECAGYNVSEVVGSARLTMTPSMWDMLYKVNTQVNHKIKPVSDQELYGEPERWVYPETAGDCEDFLLLKKRKLEKMGLPARALRITVVLDERGDGHAILTVATEDGDYVLDNRRNDILLWNDTNYTFLKRQSDKNPKQWVSLLKRPALKTAAAASAE